MPGRPARADLATPAAPKTTLDLAGERTTLANTRTHLADQRTRLALTRTMVALDRTLMAWVRTATALISFGFTFYKFFQNLPAAQTSEFERAIGPRGVALALIGVGIGSLAVAAYDHGTQVRTLSEQYHAYGPFRRSLSSKLAIVIAGLGMLGFTLVLLRL